MAKGVYAFYDPLMINKAYIQSRVTEKFEDLVSTSGQTGSVRMDHERMAYAKLDGSSVVLAYMADDKTHVSAPTLLQPFHELSVEKKEPLEALLRSLFLILMDNATAEYPFITSFFSVEPLALSDGPEFSSELLSPDYGVFDDKRSISGSESRTEVATPGASSGHNGLSRLVNMDKSARNELVHLWKQVFDPVLEYTKVSLYIIAMRVIDIFRFFWLQLWNPRHQPSPF